MRWRGGPSSENVEDRRGRGGAGVAIGGGGLLLIIILSLIFGVDPQQFLGGAGQLGPPGGGGQVQERELSPEELQQREFVAAIVGFTEVVWDDQFRRAGERYQKPKVVLFEQAVDTQCGRAPSAVGPFYCPVDETVYLDPTFFDELQNKLGGSKGEFSQAYVIAHEVGHHVQNLLGYSELVNRKRQTLPPEEFNKWSVRLELQADYLAGVWAHHGQQKFNFIEPSDVRSAITTANAIGDDRLQRRSTGFTSPENYTHGTSEQRMKWFELGLETGDLGRIDDLFKLPYDRL